MEGSIYSNFQVSNPKNEIRRIFGQKIGFFGPKSEKITQKSTLKKNKKYHFFDYGREYIFKFSSPEK